MTTMQAPAPLCGTDIFFHAREALTGKRIALVGFDPPATLEYKRVIAEVDAFARSLSPSAVGPSADTLKPFELILVNVESAEGTEWLEPSAVQSVADRCIAVGSFPVLLKLLAEKPLAFGDFRVSSESPEELMLGFVLALRGRSGPVSRKALNGSTVVLADDDPSVTALVRRALERNSLTCQIAATGGEALALITKLKPCAAVLDVHMPDIDGFEVLSRMKSVAALAQTRVILLTGCEQEADVLRGFSLGADDYVYKPFNPMELAIRLMRAIGRI